ncbi:unnamed protein product [Rotaria socialis]|uniref:FAD-binding FR-type domain-containing protein n=2 Tax=Rotaria socialis TaxID=392032 RepID=A0A821JUT6_9BILA|nr:unnamed protein product [Rotaria socialis]
MILHYFNAFANLRLVQNGTLGLYLIHRQKKNKIRQAFSSCCCKRENFEQQKNKLSIHYITDNLSRIMMLILYILINISLLIYVTIYRVTTTKSHGLVVVARICGMLLNFNCAFIIVLMLRQTILLIRSNRALRKLIPVDDHIDFHGVVGRVIIALVFSTCYCTHSIYCSDDELFHGDISSNEIFLWKYSNLVTFVLLFFKFFMNLGIGWVNGFAPLSGIILLLILVTMAICSMQWVRSGGHFGIFYWTHLLYLPFYVFLILHARDFWKWIVGPLSIFLLEKLYSIFARYTSGIGRTFIHTVTIEQSNVISLTIHRPKHFSFQPGDYVSINLPRVALYEYHPFTISSAPEETDLIRVHIQAVGNWTKRVYKRFDEMSDEEALENQVGISHADIHPQEFAAHAQNLEQTEIDEVEVERIENFRTESDVREGKREPIFVKGPYSSCARYVFDCKHVVLIGGGIGVTPYASILSSLMAQFCALSIVCKHCNRTNYLSTRLIENRRLRKVDFVWVSPDYKSFEWFLNLLRQFEQEQENYLALNPNEKRFLDLHLYFTGIKHEDNIGNAPLELATRVFAQVAGHDIFTSLKSKTNFGRPSWEKIFNRFI